VCEQPQWFAVFITFILHFCFFTKNIRAVFSVPIAHQEDGSVIIPEVLRPYMGGLEKIEPKK